MTSKGLMLEDVIFPDQLAIKITEKWLDWDSRRQLWKNDCEEVLRYVFATDTTHTSNSKNIWKNKTTIPKLCQTRDNLHANYVATLFPVNQRSWLTWEASEQDANSVRKRDAIVNYSEWSVEYPTFRSEIDKLILDFIDYGNCFATVDWMDERVQQEDYIQSGYIGPVIRRIHPNDIVFNPTAEHFRQSPKIVRSIINLGELKDLLESMSNDQNRAEYEELWKYLKDVRTNITSFAGDFQQRDALYTVGGFTSFREYLESDSVELLTFYGDIFDAGNDVFLKNHVITVVDRHKLIGKKPNPSFFGYPPIFQACWRKRQDNLWGQGPLSNLVGMQYRLDQVENQKADILDLTSYPVQKVKGFVEDYVWRPGEKIYVSEEGDVDLVQPNINIMALTGDIQYYFSLMEEIAGAPKEAMGFRTPGEKTKYEVQRLENAASRIFQNKIRQFEEQMVEPLLNAMIELARRNLTGATTIKVFDDELKIASFQSLTVEDITGAGRIKPIAARHFAEQADLIQNLTGLTNSQLWPIVQPHISGIQTAKVIERIFNLQDYKMVTPYIALAEQADAQKQANALQEQVATEATTATGQGQDFDLSMIPNFDPQAQAQQQDMALAQELENVQ